MKKSFRAFLGWSVLVQCAVSSCAAPADQAVPEQICGVSVSSRLTRSLLTSKDDLREFSRVDRAEAVTAPCILQSGEHAVLGLRFAWDDAPTDLMYLAGSRVSRIAEPHAVPFPFKTIVGNDGAISQTPCKTRGGRYFTLTLQLPQVRLGDRGRRADIEAFMRAYFPATVATLGCGT
ncbi:hypothetical protein ABT270_23005 [Streptomyces sp900105245]|uniref:hypothetical protein n=1 Tax=Streptomyces sp. 900105245 TaxID=3154379 RepID=UPI00332B2E68